MRGKRVNYAPLLIITQCVTKVIAKNNNLMGKKQVKFSTTKQKIIRMMGYVGEERVNQEETDNLFTVQVVPNISIDLLYLRPAMPLGCFCSAVNYMHRLP
jgi:hypothetical protein